MSLAEILVFDMDGVLVEVTESYRETICRTVQHFTGQTITRELVQEYKNRGGFNNDWLLSQKIAGDLGAEVPYGTIVDYFNSIFFGSVVDGVPDGLMAREVWIPNPGVLEKLSERYQLAIFTGRLREEAQMTLRRFAPRIVFHPLIGADAVVNAKPAPEGLIQIRDRFPGKELWYVGDTVDDARSASAAGVPFFGIAASGVSQRHRLLELFEQERAMAVVENINQLPEVLPS
ncbi:MAG: HAD-IA family hydrolase [Acidobacteriia bacterium]|nr:HAD-IA family hydrolase [Terriglobia bacterium]